MKVKAHYLHPPATEFVDYLRSLLGPGIDLTAGSDVPVPAKTQILIAGRPTRDQLLASSTLETLIIPWSGLPTETRELMVDFPNISVHNIHHNAGPVAEIQAPPYGLHQAYSGHRLHARGNPRLQVTAFHVFHGDVVEALHDADVEDRDGVAVIQARNDAPLIHKTF